MHPGDYRQPSDLALGHLKRLVEGDRSLSSEIRAAALTDLASDHAELFSTLRKLLTSYGKASDDASSDLDGEKYSRDSAKLD